MTPVLGYLRRLGMVPPPAVTPVDVVERVPPVLGRRAWAGCGDGEAPPCCTPDQPPPRATWFITVKAPLTGLATSSVTVLVGAACARAGVSRFGPHGMRHAAACDLLAAGASMEEIGQLLRHAQQRTTAIYARLDQSRLADLARPCRQGAPR